MADLQAILITLAAYGKPKLGMYGSSNGWHCGVDMHVNATGAKFEVASGYDHPTPLAAARECLIRMRAILAGFGADLQRLEDEHLRLEAGRD